MYMSSIIIQHNPNPMTSELLQETPRSKAYYRSDVMDSQQKNAYPEQLKSEVPLTSLPRRSLGETVGWMAPLLAVVGQLRMTIVPSVYHACLPEEKDLVEPRGIFSPAVSPFSLTSPPSLSRPSSSGAPSSSSSSSAPPFSSAVALWLPLSGPASVS